MKTNRVILVVLVFLIWFQVAWAKTLYRYQRDDGVEVTTDYFDNVPEKYRNSVEKIVVPEESKSKTKLKMKENIEKGLPALCKFSFWESEFEKMIIGMPEDEVLNLLGTPKNVSGSARSKSKTWGYTAACWSVRDEASNTVARTVILTLELKNQNYYVVDIYCSR